MPNVSNPQIQDILCRLSALENVCSNIQDVQGQLSQKICVVQEENLRLGKDILSNEKDNMTLEKAIGSLQQKMKNMEDICIPSLRKKSVKCEDKNKRLNREIQTLKAKNQEMESRLNQLSGLSKALNRALVDTQNVRNLSQKVDGLESRTDAIEKDTHSIEDRVNSIQNRFDCISESVTKVTLSPNDNTITKTFVKLDKCSVQSGDFGLMDESSGCMVPKWDGHYVLGITFAQFGEGKIRMYMKGLTPDVNGYFIGMTTHRNDVYSSVVVKRLCQGQKVWVVAERVVGEPKVGWCVLTCWFLSP